MRGNISDGDPFSQDVARHYDQLDRFCLSVWGERVHHGYWRAGRETRVEAEIEMENLVLSLLASRVHVGGRILDVGCGYGSLARGMVSHLSAQVTGVNISPAQVRRARARPHPGTEFLQGDWLTMEPTVQRYDAVTCIESTEHMADKTLLFDRIAAALKPGGHLVMNTWLLNGEASDRMIRWLVNPVFAAARVPISATVEDYRQCAERAGLHEWNVTDLTESVYRTWSSRFSAAISASFLHPKLLRFLLDWKSGNPLFAFALWRAWIAYRSGAIRYYVITARKREDSS